MLFRSAREQTVARRINTDVREVAQGVDQVLKLTQGGLRNVTGTTFANVKDDGIMNASFKALTNPISNTESQMYDAMMYPLVKAMALFQNPDYRPTENDVKNNMRSYKAAANEPHTVQLEKMAELKRNFMSASEAYLDSSILNAQQAAAVKQEVRHLQEAIPWNVGDVVDFSRQRTYKDFKSYMESKGKAATAGPSGLPEGWSVQERK